MKKSKLLVMTLMAGALVVSSCASKKSWKTARTKIES